MEPLKYPPASTTITQIRKFHQVSSPSQSKNVTFSPHKQSPTESHIIAPYELSDEEDNVLNDKISEIDQIQVMDQENKILSKYQNELYLKPHPKSNNSWLGHTIK